MNPLTALPANVRKAIYAFYATLGITFGATQVAYATAHADQPTWLLVAFGVFGYLGTALGLVAAANTQQAAGLSSKQAAEYGRQFADREKAAATVAARASGAQQITKTREQIAKTDATLAAIDVALSSLHKQMGAAVKDGLGASDASAD